MQPRTVGLLIVAASLVLGQAGCRNLPRGRPGLARLPEIRTIAGVGSRPERLATRDRTPPSTISSRVDPTPADGEAPADQILGQVLDDRGIPVANARVRLAVDGAPGGREVEGTTNRSGRFLLKGLRPGEHYTLIAEWDDGQERLLGRSSVSAPAEEVEIRVASVGEADRAELTSGSRLESGGVPLFREVARTPIPESARDGGRDEPRSSMPSPARPESGPAPDDARRPRSGWQPSDGVRRASLDPQLDASAIAGLPAEVDPETRRDDGRRDAAGEGPARPGRPASSSRIPEEIELPEPILDQPPAGPLGPPPGALPGPVARPPVPVRPDPRRTPGSPRPIGGTPVRTFEPAAEPEEDDPDRPDPPLLSGGPSPPARDRTPEATAADAAPVSNPGAMQLAPRPVPEPIAPPEDTPAFVAPPEAPSREEPGVEDGPQSSAPPPASPTPGPAESDPGPEPGAGSGTPIEVAPLPDEGAGEIGGEPTAASPVEVPAFRWADLPPPHRIVSREEGDAEAAAEGRGGEDSGRSGWGSGLLRLVRGDRAAGAEDTAVEPEVRIDEETGALGDLVLPDLQGKPYRLNDAESEFVLLCFWGTWCDPCLAALPHLDELRGQFGPERLRVVSIAYERDGQGGPRSVARTARRLGLKFPVLLAPADGSCPVASAFEVQYFPTFVLLDREGRVVHRETGATGETLMALDRAVASAMADGVMTVTRR